MARIPWRGDIRNTPGVAPGGRVKRWNDGLLVCRLLGHQEAAVRCQQICMSGSSVGELRRAPENLKRAQQDRLLFIMRCIWQQPGIVALLRGRRSETTQIDMHHIIETL